MQKENKKIHRIKDQKNAAQPIGYWSISDRGNIHYFRDMADEIDKDHRAIDNYFKTKEEAEKAVEKLKAWKRLKDTITCIDRATFDYVGTATLFIRYEEEYNKKVKEDLDLLFGGDDEES